VLASESQESQTMSPPASISTWRCPWSRETVSSPPWRPHPLPSPRSRLPSECRPVQPDTQQSRWSLIALGPGRNSLACCEAARSARTSSQRSSAAACSLAAAFLRFRHREPTSRLFRPVLPDFPHGAISSSLTLSSSPRNKRRRVPLFLERPKPRGPRRALPVQPATPRSGSRGVQETAVADTYVAGT